MKMKYDVVPGFILSAWMLRRAALTGREANGGTLWRYHLCLQPISLEQQLGSGSWLAATTADGEQQLKMHWGVLIDL
jgi:hypothetical protein